MRFYRTGWYRTVLLVGCCCLPLGCSNGKPAPPQNRSTGEVDADAPDKEPADKKPAELARGEVLSTNDPLAAVWQGAQLIDLTHAFNASTIYWPTAAGFRMTKDSDGITEKGYYYAANSFQAAEHGGTHLDAPIHFRQAGTTADKIPLERLLGEAVVVDLSAECAGDPDYQITVDDLHNWEVQHDQHLVDVIVLLRTGYAKHWPDREKYLGTRQLGPDAVALLHFPGLHPDAAKWLGEHRAVKAVGIDTASIDFGQSTHFQSHITLFQHDIPVFENVDLSDSLPTDGFSVVALPMKIEGGSGGPLRIVAILPPTSDAE
ncbi:cyclase family protein [Lignipirellula cremea]|uniref:Kynurenine formamidase n=1 Tax=Lignipirellula cremea TaxID=2528010 RepID=A0A518DTU0_9BACT|nr:cyclase family protein [Lignipirellula cremea]QDU95262.1 Kynurenine formamidase [Lignipirellula cremea]